MSLILDALRKADAERDRGSVPGLRSQPVVPLSAEAAPMPAARPGWLVALAIGAAVAATLAFVAAWAMFGRGTPERGELPVSTPASTSAQAPVQPMAVNDAPSMPAASQPAAMPAGAAASGQQAVAEPAPWPRAEDRAAARPEAGGSAPAASAGAAADAPIYPRELLPPNIRSALPPIAIGGSIYSPDPASRSLIINGQLYRERQRLTQDLALQEIRLKSAIFDFRGYRFEVLF